MKRRLVEVLNGFLFSMTLDRADLFLLTILRLGKSGYPEEFWLLLENLSSESWASGLQNLRRKSIMDGSTANVRLVPESARFAPSTEQFTIKPNPSFHPGVGRTKKPGTQMIGRTQRTFSKEVIMKRSGIILGVILLSIMLIVPASASDLKKELGEARYNKAVENLLVALKTTNTNDGLRRSAIYMLGELQADDAVIPLMAVLRNCHDAKCRIAAAWALCKIGDARGTYAVKQAVRFDDNMKVQLHSAWYYNLYVAEGTFAFIPSETAPTQIAELR